MERAVSISRRQARRLAIGAQGLGSPRPTVGGNRSDPARLRRVMDRVGTIQLDAVSVLERTQYLVPFSRIGGYDPARLRAMTGPGGEWFEFWGHAASLLPLEAYPLFRWKMDAWRNDLGFSPAYRERRRQWREAHREYLARVLDEVTDRGPLTAAELSDPRRQTGTWWDRRSDGRTALEMLFEDGVLAAWRGPDFARIYDLTERVIPAGVLARPVPPPEEAQRELVARAAGCLGVATVADLADYFWIRPGPARARVDELVEEGRLVPVAVEGWKAPAYLPAGARARPLRRRHATLVSPFDSLIWNRPRTLRLFDFHYRIGIYVPGHLRTHGYYVLPLLVGDRLVARFDLKADRAAGVLSVLGSYLEPGEPSASVADLARVVLDLLRDWLGLGRLSVGPRGDLARGLRRAVASSAGPRQ